MLRFLKALFSSGERPEEGIPDPTLPPDNAHLYLEQGPGSERYRYFGLAARVQDMPYFIEKNRKKGIRVILSKSYIGVTASKRALLNNV